MLSFYNYIGDNLMFGKAVGIENLFIALCFQAEGIFVH